MRVGAAGLPLLSPHLLDDPLGRALACTIAGFDGDADLHVMMNMFWEPLTFEVPQDPQRGWHVAVDTLTDSKPVCTATARSTVFPPSMRTAIVV